MKKRWLLFTAVAAAGILAAGIFLLPLAYFSLFPAEGIVEEEGALPESLGAAPRQLLETFWYPAGEERDEVPWESIKDHVEYRKDVLGPQLHERAFGLVGLEEDESFWKNLWNIKGEDWYLIEAPVEKEGRESLLTVVMNDGLLPFLVRCQAEREPSDGEMEKALRALQELSLEQDGKLRAYTEEIDGIYGDCPDYWHQVIELYISLLPETEQQVELPPQIPLWECCLRGTWQICADEREIALVCVMGKGSLVLYYDAVAEKFCGFRFWPPEGWR